MKKLIYTGSFLIAVLMVHGLAWLSGFEYHRGGDLAMLTFGSLFAGFLALGITNAFYENE